MRWKLVIMAFCVSLGLGGTAFAQNSGAQTSRINDVETFQVQEKNDGTYIRIEGSKVPTFSVFKLNQPLRLFIDISNSELKGETKTERVNNGVISQVALIEFKDDVRSVTRVIIGFDEAAHYDVRTEGDDVVVFVDGAKRRASSNSVASMSKELQLREARLKKLEATFEAQLAKSRAAANEARASLAVRESELARLETKLRATTGQDKERVQKSIAAKNSEIAQMKREVEGRNREVTGLKSEIGGLHKEVASLTKKAALSAKERDAALQVANDKAREGELAQNRAAKLEKSLLATEQEFQAVSSKKQTLETELGHANRDLTKKNSEVRRAQQELDAASAREKSLTSQVASLRKAMKSGDVSVASDIARLEKERSKSEKVVASQKAQLKTAHAQVEKASNQLTQTQRRLQSRDSEIVALKAELRRAQAAKTSASNDVANAENARIQALERALSNEKAQVATLEKNGASVSRLKSDLANARTELDALKAKRSVAVGRAVAVTPNVVRGIKLETVGTRSRIVVDMDQPGTFETLPWKDSRAVMILNDVNLPANLEKTLASSGQAGAVRFVSTYRDNAGRVRLEAELGENATEVVRQDGKQLVWEFAAAPVLNTVAYGNAQTRPEAETFSAAPPNYPMVVADPTQVSRVPGMKRTRISIDLRQADIQNVLRLLAKKGGVNVVAGEGVKGEVTIRLRSVPLDEVFLTVLQARKLGFEKRGNVIRVAPQSTLQAEQARRAEARKARANQQPLEVFLMPVNYADAKEMEEQVATLLSSRGAVTIDKRTNTLIIKDIPENLAPVRALVESLDTQVPQVLIEARIVETNDTFVQALGIQWGGDTTFSQANGNPTGLVFPGVLGLAGGATDAQAPTAGTSSTPNFAVNLPTAVGTGSGGSLGLTMGSVGGAVNLNLRLTALEAAGHAKIVSSPKILTLDNQSATISQGTSIPISVVSAAGVQTVFVDATLELKVTPHVTPDGNIQLEVSASKNEPDFQNTGARGDPTIIRKQAETELLIKDGDTTVIGGIYTRNSGSSISAVPFFHKIPILGFFFRTESESERRTELLIFITPKIVNRAEALGENKN